MYNLDPTPLYHSSYKEQVIVMYIYNQEVWFKPPAAVRSLITIGAAPVLPCGPRRTKLLCTKLSSPHFIWIDFYG